MKKRLYGIDVPIFAITGSVATGKSTVSRYLSHKGHPVLCADRLVKLIYGQQQTKEFISKLCPDLVCSGNIDFGRLRESFFSHHNIKEQVESFLYPKLKEQFQKELKKLKELGPLSYLFYDIPLLFEKSSKDLFDQTIVVYCTQEEQLKRIMKRDSISQDLAQKMMATQMSIEEKKKRADYVLENTSQEKLPEKIQGLLSFLGL